MSDTRDTTRVGIVGAGFIGRTVGEEFVGDSRASVVGLADIDASTRNRTGERLGVPPTARYEEYTALYEEVDLDAVVVATPHTLHYDQITAAMDRGLHVLCEKPLTTDLDHARELAARTGPDEPVLFVGYQRHLNEAYKRARERFAAADGDPQFITAEITQDWIDRFDDAWRTDPALSGGGYLYDTGSHILDAILWTTGLDPVWVESEMTFAEPAVDVSSVTTIGFDNGATATVSLHGDAPATREHIHIWDDEGAVYLEGREWESRSYSEIDADSTTTTPYIRHDDESKAGAFLDSIHRGVDPAATAEDALAVTAVTEAAYESAATGERVSVDL